jgi:hypothetical protein
VAYGEFPIFIIEGKRGMIYGFPDFEGRGVKARAARSRSGGRRRRLVPSCDG